MPSSLALFECRIRYDVGHGPLRTVVYILPAVNFDKAGDAAIARARADGFRIVVAVTADEVK